jgi:lambda family phage tail tape measure protein
MFGDNGEITSDTSGLDELLAQGTKKTREELNKLAEATTQASSVATSALQAMFNTLSGQLAKVFAGGTVSFEQFSQQVFSIIGDLLIQLGMMAIASAKIFESFGNPFTSIAAGLAAIALGAAIKGMVNKVRGGEIMEFASGGIISGPTLGLMGEYAGARHNPEVVAPLDKLKSMIGSNGSQNLSGEFVVRGQDLVVALQRAERNRNRFK